MRHISGKPEADEAGAYYWPYIDRVSGGDIVATLEAQLHESLELFATISDAQSMHRYAPDKWTIRGVVNHLTDTERVFAFRILWFARGFPTALPSYDQLVASAAAHADAVAWGSLIEEFRNVRLATLSLLEHLPDEAWTRRGTASGAVFSVRGLAYLTAGHVIHHVALIRGRYLVPHPA